MVSGEIITLDELKAYLGITDESQDDKLQMIVDAVNQSMTNELGRVFGTTVIVTDEVYDYKPTVFLLNIDINSVEAVSAGRQQDTPVEIDADSYFYNREGRLVLSSTFVTTKTKENYDYTNVSYTYGQTDVPADLKMAGLQMGSTLNASYGAGEIGEVASERIGSYAIDYVTDTAGTSGDSSVSKVINSYKRIKL